MPFIDPKPGKRGGMLNGTGEKDIPPFSRGYPPERDDVGIVPYIPSGCIPFNRARQNRQAAGGWQPPCGFCLNAFTM